MAHFINPIQEEECVSISLEGQVLPEEIAATRLDALKIMTATGWRKILVDITAMQSIPKATELYELGNSLFRDVPHRGRIALLVRPDQVRHIRFFEQVARKAGAFVTFFLEMEKASGWLQRGSRLKRPQGVANGSTQIKLISRAS